jgi:hypothetical protein
MIFQGHPGEQMHAMKENVKRNKILGIGAIKD